MVNSEELIGTTEYLTLYTRCGINRCRYKRATYEHSGMYYTKQDGRTTARANLLGVHICVYVCL
jgi:hypothetical protein